MAVIDRFIKLEEVPGIPQTNVSADYCFDESTFQLRTYKDGDTSREEGSKQNIQLSKPMAKELVKILQEFIAKT